MTPAPDPVPARQPGSFELGPIPLTLDGLAWAADMLAAAEAAELARLEQAIAEAAELGVGVLVHVREYDRTTAPSALVPAGTVYVVDETAIARP